MLEITLKVEGMACPMCEAHVNQAVRNVADVKKVTSSHSKGTTVILADQPLELDKIKQAIEENGYKVLDVVSTQKQKKSLFSFKK